jgi:hypothetical protein
MATNNNEPDADSDSVGPVPITLGTVLLLAAGLLLLYIGIDGIVSGEIRVAPKGVPRYIATRYGSHAREYFVQVGVIISLGLLITSCAVAFLVSYWMAQPAVRKNMLRKFMRSDLKQRN